MSWLLIYFYKSSFCPPVQPFTALVQTMLQRFSLNGLSTSPLHSLKACKSCLWVLKRMSWKLLYFIHFCNHHLNFSTNEPRLCKVWVFIGVQLLRHYCNGPLVSSVYMTKPNPMFAAVVNSEPSPDLTCSL